ncbi:MAG: hypothetical protein ACFFCS_08835 [Candidatus Hodarchaeota archaeon]
MVQKCTIERKRKKGAGISLHVLKKEWRGNQINSRDISLVREKTVILDLTSPWLMYPHHD